MFNNIGEKIKALAVIICWIGIILSVICGLAIMVIAKGASDSFFVALLIIAFGSLGSWIGSFFMYGLGQLIENSDVLVENTNILIVQNEKKANGTHPSHSNISPAFESNTIHKWRCPKCENVIDETVCPYCGNHSNSNVHTENTAIEE